MTKLVNRAKVVTAATGTGSTITLGSAVSGFQTFADAGVANGDTVRYVIEDGNSWEIGTGTYTATGTTLSRTVSESSNAGAAINLSGSAVVYVSMSAAEMLQQADIGVSVQAHDANIVSDAAYVHTDNNYTTTEKSKLAGIEAGATADQTAAEILTAIKTVDGTGSGLDADLLDGNDSSAFYLATNPNGYTTNTGTVTSVAASVPTGFSLSGSPITTSGTLGITYAAGYQGYTTTEASKLAGIEAGADVTDAGNVTPLVDTHLNTGAATTGQYLGWNGADYSWSTVSGYTDAAVDTHLNTGTATTGEVLSWTGADYDWVAVSVPNISINANSVAVGVNADNFYEGVTVGLNAGTNGGVSQGSIAIGHEAGRYIKGTYNIGIGVTGLRGGFAGLTGSNNIGIGYQTGYDLSTGAYNFLGGYQAGTNLTTGSNNVFIGQTAGLNTTVHSNIVAIGDQAARTTGADDIIAIGDTAAYTGSGYGGIGIGRRALYTATGALNTALGTNAGDVITTGTNNTCLGANADASSATVSNEITLGDAAITRFRIPAAGIDNTSDALTGTTPSVDVGARDTYTLTTSGNTTFTFTGAPSSGQVGTFSLIITAGGTHTLTWPASVDWAGGVAPDAPASGEKDIYTFMTIDGGTIWYGFLAGDAVA